jgi:hypothetical protein
MRRIDFLLTVEGSRISRATACEAGAAAARLRSAFDLSGGSEVLRVDAHRTWRCAGGVLTMQPLPAD